MPAKYHIDSARYWIARARESLAWGPNWVQHAALCLSFARRHVTSARTATY